MAVNKIDATGGRITLQGDYVVHHQDEIEFTLEGDRIPTFLVDTHNGDMFLTNMRLIFVNRDPGKGYHTFAMDFLQIRNTEVKQPIFGANYIKGYVSAEPNGGWEGSANFKINFPKGGAIDFAEKFQRTVEDSLRLRQNGSLPPPPNGFYPQSGTSVPMTGGFYPPPQAPGFYAYQSSNLPPAGAPLYGAPQPPPPAYSAYPNVPPTQGQYQNSAKAQEAYINHETNTVYIPEGPPPPYNPSYDDGSKKNQ